MRGVCVCKYNIYVCRVIHKMRVWHSFISIPAFYKFLFCFVLICVTKPCTTNICFVATFQTLWSQKKIAPKSKHHLSNDALRQTICSKKITTKNTKQKKKVFTLCMTLFNVYYLSHISYFFCVFSYFLTLSTLTYNLWSL